MKIRGIHIIYDPEQAPILKYIVRLDVEGKSFEGMLANPRTIALRGVLSLLFVWLTYWLCPVRAKKI